MQTEIELSMQAQAMQANSLTATTTLTTEEILSGNFIPNVFGGYSAITQTVQDAEVIEYTTNDEQVDVTTDTSDMGKSHNGDNQSVTTTLSNMGENHNCDNQSVVMTSVAEPEPVSSITTVSLFSVGQMNEVHHIAETEKEIMDLWHGYIHDESISILFADTNVGKSILAVQICNEIAHSYPTEKVVYFDFEMTNKQRQSRYHTDNGTYCFENNLYVSSIQSYLNSDDSIVDGIVSVIQQLSPKVICVDNLKAIFGDVEKGKECKEFLMRMKQIKDTYNCTIILINHTNKSYKKGDPLNLNMMAGSKNIANFSDEILAVGASCSDDNIVYIKQLKTRASAKTNTVAQYTITKCDNGNLVFAYNKQTVEQALLKTKDELEQIEAITEMMEDGKSIRQIATALNMSSATVGRRVQMIKQQKEQEEQEDNDD